MKASTIKAVLSMSEFFTYNVTPEEFSQIMQRASILEETTRDREIMHSLAQELHKALTM